MSVTEEAAEKWRSISIYLGNWQLTGKKQEGAPVYLMSYVGFLYRHSDGTWHASRKLGDHYGDIKSVGTAECPANNSQWQYVDNDGNWKPSGDITVKCYCRGCKTWH